MYLFTEKPKRAGLSFTHYERKGKHTLKSTIVKLYDTRILISDNDSIKLNSGGFRTNHTKNVINDFLPSGYGLSQKKGVWYVTTPSETVEFYDGIIFKVGA